MESAFNRFAQIKTQDPPPWKHIGYAQFKRIFGDYFETMGCDIFVVVRDPIDVLISWYTYRRRPALADSTHPSHDNYTGDISLYQFVREWASSNPPSRARLRHPMQVCFDSEGRLAPINYYRYESLAQLIQALQQRVGEEVQVPQKNTSPKLNESIDRKWFLSHQKMRDQMDVYESIPFLC